MTEKPSLTNGVHLWKVVIPYLGQWLADKGVPIVLLMLICFGIYRFVFVLSPRLLDQIQGGYDRNAIQLKEASFEIGKGVAEALVEAERNRELLGQLNAALQRDMEQRSRRLDLVEKQVEEMLRLLRRNPQPPPDNCFLFRLGVPLALGF